MHVYEWKSAHRYDSEMSDKARQRRNRVDVAHNGNVTLDTLLDKEKGRAKQNEGGKEERPPAG